MPNFHPPLKSPCSDKIAFDTQPCWQRSSLLCNTSPVRQGITCKKMIHCCLTEGWQYANSSSLRTPHMHCDQAWLLFGVHAVFMHSWATFLCIHSHSDTAVRPPLLPLAVRGLPHKPPQGRPCSCIGKRCGITWTLNTTKSSFWYCHSLITFPSFLHQRKLLWEN